MFCLACVCSDAVSRAKVGWLRLGKLSSPKFVMALFLSNKSLELWSIALPDDLFEVILSTGLDLYISYTCIVIYIQHFLHVKK